MTISPIRPPASRPSRHPPLSLCVRLAGQITAVTMLLCCLPFVLLFLGIALGLDLGNLFNFVWHVVGRLVLVNVCVVAALVLRESLK